MIHTREEFIAAYCDELTGLLLTSFAESDERREVVTPLEMALRGKRILAQMRRARDLLGRIWDNENTKVKPVPVNGQRKEVKT